MVKFPTINNIKDLLPAIQDRPEFVVAEKEGYVVVNYNVIFEDTFINPEEIGISEEESFHRYLRREARGIIFDSQTGDIIRRPFHKFFNVNEREETQDHVIDLSRPHAILEKLDGSMIAPFIVNGQMIWGTKMGATDVAKPVEEFVKNNPNYISFATSCLISGYTPIFEWCSRKQRIVLDYKEDQLVLTAIRNIHTGKYMNRIDMVVNAQIDMIPVVRAFDITNYGEHDDMKAFLEYVRDLEDMEGYVVRFSDGHMIKLKCDWYVQIHKAKEAILQDRNIVEIILNEKLDDIKAHLPAEDRDRLTQFESDFNHAVFIITNDIRSEMRGIKDMDRKTFALTVAPQLDAYTRPIIFKNFDGSTFEKIEADVRNTIRNNLTKTAKYEAIHDAWFLGVKYND